jgi:hypothetical protein
MKVIDFSHLEKKLTLELSFDELSILSRVATAAASNYSALGLEEDGLTLEEVDQSAEDISGVLGKAIIKGNS